MTPMANVTYSFEPGTPVDESMSYSIVEVKVEADGLARLILRAHPSPDLQDARELKEEREGRAS